MNSGDWTDWVEPLNTVTTQGGGAVGNKGVPVGMRPPSYTSSTAVAFSCYEVLDLGMNGFPS